MALEMGDISNLTSQFCRVGLGPNQKTLLSVTYLMNWWHTHRVLVCVASIVFIGYSY